MLDNVGCRRVLTTPNLRSGDGGLRYVEDVIRALAPGQEVEFMDIPALEELFPKLGCETARDEFTPFPKLEARQNQNLDDVAFYMYTSGTTGTPKAVPHTQRFMRSRCVLSCKYRPLLATARLYLLTFQHSRPTARLC